MQCLRTGWMIDQITFQMRDVIQTEELDIPSSVEITIKSRLISVTGPRGTLNKSVRHVDMDIVKVSNGKSTKVTLAVWQGGRKHVACLRTIRSLINNMVIGVTKVRRNLGIIAQSKNIDRDSDTKCVLYMPISRSIALSRRMDTLSRSVIFWAKRCAVYYLPSCRICPNISPIVCPTRRYVGWSRDHGIIAKGRAYLRGKRHRPCLSIRYIVFQILFQHF